MTSEVWVPFAILLVTGLVSFLVAWGKAQNQIEAVATQAKQDTRLLQQDLDNQKANHNMLQVRFETHQRDIEGKLEKIDSKIDDLKDLIIQRTEKQQ